MELRLAGVGLRHAGVRPAPVAALTGLDLRVRRGEQVAIIGPSGAGKTSLLQLLAASLKPSEGQLEIGGVAPWRLTPRALQALRRRLFLAPQVPPLPPRQRVIAAVMAGRLPVMSLAQSLRNLVYPVDIPAAYEALDALGLGGKLFERVDRLSGGERQRVALARALLAPASLWLIDEPLSALDPSRARQALEVLLRVARERGVTVVASLHQVDLALEAFGRVVGLREGRIVFDTTRAQDRPLAIDALYAMSGAPHGSPLVAGAINGAADAMSLPLQASSLSCR